PGYFITRKETEDVARRLREAFVFVHEHNKTNGRQRLLDLGLDSETVAKKIIRIYREVLDEK
ncbi:MAG: glycosyl transferase group 1, partial [Candidatus Kuenenia stuttgartiensis]|nr:glycosyl transferase group 1 [Candidatus Kuenenia stuttgartiensis]